MLLSGSITSNVTNGAIFTNTGAVTGTVSSSVTFNNNAAGTVSGLLTNTAGTTTNNGQLNGGANITGGVLTGIGSAGNTSIAGGTFTPGSGVAGTSMTINGTLGFTAPSTYAVFLNPTTSSFTTVTGAATLGGATVNATFAAGTYVAKQYTILTAASIIGTFGTLNNTNLPTNFTAALSYDGTHAYLDLALGYTSPGGLSGNQSNVSNALTNYFNRTGGIPAAFASLTANGLTQVSGESGTGSTQASFIASNQFMNLLLDPYSNNRSDNDAGGAGSFASTDGPLGYASSKRADRGTEAYAAVTPRDKLSASRADAFGKRWSVWAGGYGGSSTTSGDNDAGTHSTTSRVYGTAVGTDYRLSSNSLVGFALGGAGTNFNLADSLGGGRAEVFQAGAFGRHDMGLAYFSAALAYGWQKVTTERTVTSSGTDILHAEFNAHTFAARGETGYRVNTAFADLIPYAALQVTSFKLPGYGETATSGSNQFALTYASQTTTNLRTELGARTNKSFRVHDGIFSLRGRAAWAHDSNTDRPVTATFQTLPSATFTVNGAQAAANSALLSAGAEMKWRSGIVLAGTFEGEFSNTTQSYAGKGTIRYTW